MKRAKDEEKDLLRLAAGTKVFCDGGVYGLKTKASCRYAANAEQTAILRVLEKKSATLDELFQTVADSLPKGTPPCMASLKLAEFILDFEGYLER